MLIGYARTSTTEQEAGFESQLRELGVFGCSKFFSEQKSSVAARDQLEAAIDYLRDGDTLVVTKLDRLARSMRDLVQIVDRIEAKNASLNILAMNMDTSTPTGRLMLNVIGSVAQFEREMMLERQREGIAAAKVKGAYKGRKPTARAKGDDVRRLHAEGKKVKEIMAELNLGYGSVYRAIHESV